ncbi:MAG: hypothetical protein D6732_03605 [Methanobacteriota archaeon]|nr:MAG: hypothetical protein D6732_03605 [Euryarchaeota archaeon]
MEWIKLFSEIYPKPLTIRKKILDFDEFHERLLDQGEGYQRIAFYPQALAVLALLNAISNRPLIVLFSCVWLVYLYVFNVQKFRITFTEKRVVFRNERLSSRLNLWFVLFGFAVILLSQFSIMTPLKIIQDLFIPRIWPALIVYIFAITIPSLLIQIPLLSNLITIIIFLLVTFLSLRNEVTISQNSYKMTKSVLLKEHKVFGLKTLRLLGPVFLVQVILNLLGILTKIFIFDLASFILFPFSLLILLKYRTETQYSFSLFNPIGGELRVEILLDEINFQRIVKALSNIFSFTPHPFGNFPDQIIDTSEFSMFPTGSKPIKNSIVPVGFNIGAGVAFITVVLASITAFLRQGDALGTVFLGIPLLWAIYFFSFQAIRRLSRKLVEGDQVDMIIFNSEIFGYISKHRLWISSIVNLEQNDLTKRMPLPLRQKNSLLGDYTNWKLIILYGVFFFVYGILVQWIRFGALNAEGLYKIGVYYYSITIQVFTEILLTQPLVMLFISILLWVSLILFLPQFLLLTHPSLRMDFGKNAFLSHPSGEITDAVFMARLLISFKFFASQRASTSIRPSYAYIVVGLKYDGHNSDLLVRVENNDSKILKKNNPYPERMMLKVGIYKLSPLIKLTLSFVEGNEERSVDLKISRHAEDRKLQFSDGSSLEITLHELIFRD